MHLTLLLVIVAVPLYTASPWSGIFIDTSSWTEISGVIFDVNQANATGNGVVGTILAANNSDQISDSEQRLMMVCKVRIDEAESNVVGAQSLHHVLRWNSSE